MTTGSASSKPAIEVITGFSGSIQADRFKTGHRNDHRLFGRKRGCRSQAERSSGASEAYRELIELELSRGRNAMGIWQDLVDDHGFTGGYESVKRFVRKLRGAASPEARAIIVTPPGEECQVDYGTGPMVRDPDTGKYRRTRLFVLTLGYSRKCVRAAGLPIECAGVGRAAREGISPAWRFAAGRGPRQPSRRRAVAGLLRSGCESVVSRCSGPLRRDGAALPSARSGSKRQSRIGRRPCAEDAAEGQEASRAWKKRRRTWITGKKAGPTPASTARPSGR